MKEWLTNTRISAYVRVTLDLTDKQFKQGA